jgi:HEAT repeat protein
LAKLLQDPDPEARKDAIEALVLMRSPKAIPVLRGILAEGDDDTRRDAISALAALKAQEAAPDLTRLLKDPNPNIAGQAATALGDLKHAPAVPVLIEMLKATDDDSRYIEAAISLGKIGDPRALPALRRLAQREAKMRPPSEAKVNLHLINEAISRIRSAEAQSQVITR